MVQEIVGSHLKSQSAYGETSDATPSSIHPGSPPIKRSAFAKSVIAAEGSVSAAPGDFQTRRVSSEQKVPTTPGMLNPNASPARVPLSNIRKANDGLFRATKR